MTRSARTERWIDVLFGLLIAGVAFGLVVCVDGVWHG